MDSASVNRVAVPAVLFCFALLALVRPSLRAKRRLGRSAVVLERAPGALGRALGLGFKVAVGLLALWTALYAILGPAPLGVRTPPWPALALGWALVLAGFALVVVAQAAMGDSWRIGIDDRPTALVTGSVFGLVRNPIFSAMLLMLLGLAVLAPSPWSVAAWPIAAALVAVQVRLEERHLLALHGEEYRRYAARVGRFVPGLGRLRA